MREFDDLIEGNVNNIVDPTSLFEKSWRNRKRNESRLQDLCANACKFYKSLWNVPCVERENKKKKKKKKKEKDGNEKGNETRERNENRVNEVVGKRKHSRRDHSINDTFYTFLQHASRCGIETILFFFLLFHEADKFNTRFIFFQPPSFLTFVFLDR